MLRGLRGYALHAITRESSRYTDPRLGAECPRDTGCRHAGRIKRYRLPRLFPLLAPQTCIPCPGSPCGVYPRKAHAREGSRGSATPWNPLEEKEAGPVHPE